MASSRSSQRGSSANPTRVPIQVLRKKEQNKHHVTASTVAIINGRRRRQPRRHRIRVLGSIAIMHDRRLVTQSQSFLLLRSSIVNSSVNSERNSGWRSRSFSRRRDTSSQKGMCNLVFSASLALTSLQMVVVIA